MKTPAQPPYSADWRALFGTGQRAVNMWLDADGLRMSAAMSFYGILSLAPLLVVIVALVGWWVDRTIIENNLISQIQDLIGARGAEVVQQALASAKQPVQGLVASVVAFGLLLSGATGVFAELQNSFERIWRHGRTDPAPTPSAWWRTASLRLRGIAYILAFGFLLLVSMVLTTFLNMIGTWASQFLPVAPLLRGLNEALSFAFCAALFVALMRISTGPKPSLRYLVAGAVVGSALFSAGKYGLAAYLSGAAAVSAYGAAGSLVVMLMWIYFSSGVLLFAAACARCLSDAAHSAQAASNTANAESPGAAPSTTR
jgi:membrane protein